MELSEFIDAYLDNGNTVIEGAPGVKNPKNLNRFMGMFKGLQKFPADPLPNNTGKTNAEFLGNDGTKSTIVKTSGNTAYRGTGAGAPNFSFEDGKQTVSFTPEEWEQLRAMFDNKDEEANNLEQDEEKLSALQLKKKIQTESNAIADSAALRTV